MANIITSGLIYFIIVLNCYHCMGHYQPPTVRVSQGLLRGTTQRIHSGSSYYSFKGIPYADAPVGNDRFKAPLPPKPWEGIRDAVEHGPVCSQFNATQSVGSEQCLFLNIYTKSLAPTTKMPVMVFIHGGSFMMGSGNMDMYSPDLIIQHDVILVTINYRLEIMGFLSLETSEVPGNAGMRDKVMALQWIKENIAKFGGDPDNVTIFGESSGAASVTYLIVSPMAKGLFHKVIAQSGVCIETWAQGRNMKERAIKAGKGLGIDTNDINELLSYLRSLSPGDLSNLTNRKIPDEEILKGVPEQFVPVVEKMFPNVIPFLDQDPAQVLVHGNVNAVPLMLGYNSGEGISMITYQTPRLEMRNTDLSLLVSRDISERVSKRRVIEIGAKIKEFYVGKGNFTEDNLEALRDMSTDIYIAYNVHRFASLYKDRRMPVFMYKFNFDTDLNVFKNKLNETYRHLKGAAHADDLYYMFYNYLNKEFYDNQPRLREISYKITKLWTNFAKTGNPTPDQSLGVKWPEYTKTGKEFLALEDNFPVGNYADKAHMEFWNDFYKEAGLPHIQ